MKNEDAFNMYRNDVNNFKEDFYAFIYLVRLFNSSVKKYLEGGSFIEADRYKTMNGIFYLSEIISEKLNSIENEMNEISKKYQ